MIHVRGLNKIHDPDGPGRFQSLHEIDLDVKTGELVAIQGISGSGKTTLLSILGALIHPTSGLVEIGGRSVTKLPDRHASAFRLATVGFIFQDHHLFPELSLRDNVAVPLVPTGVRPHEIEAKTRAALELANIAHKSDRKVRDLSGGEKQRCAIARALVNDPRLILCDEPTANLDRDNRETFLAILAQLKVLGKTILIATHDPLFEGAAIVDRAIVLRDGRISAS